MESTSFCLLTISRTWTDENIYTDVNSQYLQHIRIEAAHSATNTHLRTSETAHLPLI